VTENSSKQGKCNYWTR